MEEVQLEPALVPGKCGGASFPCATSATDEACVQEGQDQTGPKKVQL